MRVRIIKLLLYLHVTDIYISPLGKSSEDMMSSDMTLFLVEADSQRLIAVSNSKINSVSILMWIKAPDIKSKGVTYLCISQF